MTPLVWCKVTFRREGHARRRCVFTMRSRVSSTFPIVLRPKYGPFDGELRCSNCGRLAP